MLTKYPFIILMSFFVGMICIALFNKLALRYKILIHKGVPIIGGMSIGFSFLIASLIGLLMNIKLSVQASSIIISSAIMLIFGIIDDFRELSIVAKLLVQIIATTVLVLLGIRTQIVFFGAIPNLIITFIWILAITNAFNLLDIMDGLSAGTAIIVSFSFFIISFLNGDIKSAILSSALVGAAISFLIYNLPPAKIYMGNSGSHFLGFVLAAIALAISYAPLERKIALLSPILILGLPIFDTGFLIFMRIAKRRFPLKKSNDHIALRFLKLGYSKNKALLFMLLVCLFFSLCGVLLSRVSNFLGITIIVLVILVSLIISYRMSKVSIDG